MKFQKLFVNGYADLESRHRGQSASSACICGL